MEYKTEKKRVSQINELIRQELGSILAREIEFPAGSLPTITKVVTDHELKRANVFISVIPEDWTEGIIKSLKKQRGPIQYLLNRRLSMHFVPDIYFVKDDKSDEKEEAEHHDIEMIFNTIAKEPHQD